MKTFCLPSLLLIIFIIACCISDDLFMRISAINDGKSSKSSYISIVSIIGDEIDNRNDHYEAEYFLAVTQEYAAILSSSAADKQQQQENSNDSKSKSRRRKKKDELSIIDPIKQFPNKFRLEPDLGCTLSYLAGNNSAVLCSNKIGDNPSCLLITLSFAAADHRRPPQIASITPITVIPKNPDDYIAPDGYGSEKIWNTYRLFSDHGDSAITAYVNSTRVYEPSWIIRETLSPPHSTTDNNNNNNDKLLSSTAAGLAFDHRLARFPNHDYPPSTETVYAFRYRGYAYFLRYAYRFKHFSMADDGWTGFEWAWVLSRVCFGDRTRQLQSRTSIPLTCDFPKQPEERSVGWRPTGGYLDRDDGQFYVYVQPNVTLAMIKDDEKDEEKRREAAQLLRGMSHRVCAFDMEKVAGEFERTFSRCYKEHSPAVAVHGGAILETMECSDYKNPEMPCGHDMCDPEECVVGPYYYMEIYEPIQGAPVATINFGYHHRSGGGEENVEDSPALQRPLAMYVTKAKEDKPAAVFVMNEKGTVFMAILLGPDHSPVFNALQPPAWTSEDDRDYDPTNHHHQLWMFEAPDRAGVRVVIGEATTATATMFTFPADCGLYSKCSQLLERSTGEQARRWWACGWCQPTKGGGTGGFASTRDQCLVDGGGAYFHADSCPPAANCYNPRRWSSDENVTLEVAGYFPPTPVLQYRVSAGGAECRDVRITSTATREPAENSLTCTVSPPYLDQGQGGAGAGGVRIVVLDPANVSRILYTLEPTCSSGAGNDSSPPTDGGSLHEWSVAKDKSLLAGVVGTSVLFAAALVVYVLARRRRRGQKKRRERSNYNALSLPMTSRVTVEMSRNNEYVQRNVLGRNHLDIQNNNNNINNSNHVYEDLSHLVPAELLVDFAKIQLFGEQIGRGHFGQVFKGAYTPSEEAAAPIQVAVKTLISEADAKQFLAEGIMMESFDHPRVLSLIGIAFGKNHLPMVITPFMAKGDLLLYMRNAENTPSVGQLLQFGLEIAEGMQYLHQLKFIHRDLAARNCMLDDDNRVKIADFGLSRDVYESECYMSSQNMDLPIRWMPPESIELRQYTLKSDVWSYGVVLWELMTRGEVPYAGMTGFQVLTSLKKGDRLSRPPHCPEPIYRLIRSCWEIQPDQRPDFPTLSKLVPAAIQQLLSTNSYQTLLPNTYYNLPPPAQQQQRQQEQIIVTTAA